MRTHVISGLITASLLSIVFVLMSAQAPSIASSRTCSHDCWPPNPNAIVNLAFPSGVQVQSELVLYTVPANKYLVVLDVRMDTTNGSVDFYEDLAGNRTLKMTAGAFLPRLNTGIPSSFNAGVVFHPGSNVVLVAPGGSTPYIYLAMFSGYLVDA